MSTKVNLKIVDHVNNQVAKNEGQTVAEAARASTFELLASSFASEKYTHNILQLNTKEMETPREKNDQKWEFVCKYFCEAFVQKTNIPQASFGDPVEFYQEYLKKYLEGIFFKHIRILKARGVFEHYNPLFQPIVLFSLQLKIADDLFPSFASFIPLEQLLKYGLMPPNIKTFNPLASVKGHESLKPLCYGLFRSFSIGFNLAVAFYESADGVISYQWHTFDRSKEMTSI